VIAVAAGPQIVMVIVVGSRLVVTIVVVDLLRM
jgi:hypothetical protein